MTGGRLLLRALEILSILELLSIVVLLGNLLTVHQQMITAAIGPIHGALYLAVVATALLGRGLLMRTRLLALIPVLGGVFTLIMVRAERRRPPARI